MFVKEITKRYDGKAVVDGVSFEIPKGKVLSLIGPNGAGKSTVMGMLSRLIARDSGLVDFEGTEITRWKSRELSKRLAILTQANNVQMKLTVRELVAFGRFPYSGGRLTQEDNEIIDRAIAYMELGDFEEQFIDELSGGQRQALSLLMSTMTPIDLLILDEPTNHLDIVSKEILENALNDYTGTVLYVSHDRYFINRIATRILELKDEQLYSFIGNYDYYESHKDQVYEAAAPKQTDTSADTATAPSATPSGKDDYKKQKEEQARLRKKENDIKKTEQKIEETEAAIAQIDEEFLNPEYATNSAKLGELSKKREELEETLSALYETWETLLA